MKQIQTCFDQRRIGNHYWTVKMLFNPCFTFRRLDAGGEITGLNAGSFKHRHQSVCHVALVDKAGINQYVFAKRNSFLDDFQYRHLELKNIKVRPNTTIGKTITIDDLFRDGYSSVFIGAGLWKAKAMNIKGETLGNVAFGIDYLANPKGFKNLGDDIAVIGVGNSAMDCARTAIRNGARHVTCYARRDVSYAKLEGVDFRYCLQPVEIRKDGVIFRESRQDENGNWVGFEGTERLYPHTGVIVSVSQGSSYEVDTGADGSCAITRGAKGLLSVDEKGATTRKVIVPPGRWLGDDGKEVVGPTEIVVETPLARLPHFKRINKEVKK